MFGSSFGAKAPAFGQPAGQAAAGGMFGQTTGLFGQQQQATSAAPGLFGQQQAPSSLFGQAQPAVFGQQQAAPFGQTQQAAPFGQQPQQTTGLFGQTQQQVAPFGQTQQQAAPFGQQPQQPSSSLFAQPQQQPSSSLFAQPQPSSLFGQQSQQQPSLFGQQAQQPSSLFGQQQQQQPSSLFGQQPPQSGLFGQPAQSSSLFGSSFGSKPAASQLIPFPLPPVQPSVPAWEMEMQQILDAYDPSNPSCRFQFALYNKVEDAASIEPATAFRIHTGLYQQAIRENPDPAHLVPVPALGFEALRQRIAQQQKARGHHATELDICKERIQQLEQDHDCMKKVAIPDYRQRHLDLSRRLLRLAKTLDLHQGRGFPRSDAELRLAKELEGLERAAEKLRVSVEGISSSIPIHDCPEIDAFHLAPADPNSKRIYEFLDQQRQSLQNLIGIVASDHRDVNLMVKAYQASSTQ